MSAVIVKCPATRHGGAIALSQCTSWESFLAEAARLAKLESISRVEAIVAGERSVVESVDEIGAGDVLEVQGKPLASAPDTASGGPQFAMHHTSVTASGEAHARAASWRQAVTEVLQRQRDPDTAHRLLGFMHEAAVAAKRFAAVLAKRGTARLAPPSPSAPVVTAEPATAESLRRCPQAVAFLHRLGFRAHVDASTVDGKTASASRVARLAAAMSGAGGARFALQPSSAVELADAAAAVAEVTDGRTGLERLLAMATAMGGASAAERGEAPATDAAGAADSTERSAAAAAAAAPFSPAAIAAAQTAGGEDLSRARAEVAAMAVSLGGAEAAAPASRNAVVLPTPRSRLPEAAAPSAEASSAGRPPAPASGDDADGSDEGDGVDGERDSGDEAMSEGEELDSALPRTAAEWRAAELAHAHRMELARGGADALRARRLRATLSAEPARASPGSPTAAPPCPGGQPLRLRLVFPDSVTLVADFGPLEPSSSVAALASRCLALEEQAEGLTVQSLRPEGGAWTLRGDTPLVLAGVRNRATLSVRLKHERPAYAPSVQAAVTAGGAAVAIA
ncbi:hypothetical protein FNF31_02094 [Cafeteria roenbergensis]|uniref:Uncharacterized protein n=1 Tax=Cafeteria roenbergensis TaxID=33653 RepID=A0A5A8DMG2_CAFRO|nr:hypothetical protein FNF31_02094 [Cafeteria roenbergensis]KAA0170181.1 hypothetical protein FNF28_01602 [Cafeteria roenbergensis]